jgi:hypothetical protein
MVYIQKNKEVCQEQEGHDAIAKKKSAALDARLDLPGNCPEPSSDVSVARQVTQTYILAGQGAVM